MKNKYIYITFFLFVFLNSCQSVKQGLSGQKKSTGEEFLVERKNPLSMPPEFNKLPKPLVKGQEKKETEGTDVEAILGSKNINSDESKEISDTSTSTENSILDQIRK